MILKMLLVFVLFLLFLYLIYTKTTRFTTQNFSTPSLYLTDLRDFDKLAISPIKDYRIELTTSAEKQKEFIKVLKAHINTFAENYSFFNRIKIQYNSFKIQNIYRIFGFQISEYTISCDLLNELFRFCRKYNNMDLFYNILDQFVEILSFNLTKTTYDNNDEIVFDKMSINKFKDHPKDIMFFIAVNWND